MDLPRISALGLNQQQLPAGGSIPAIPAGQTVQPVYYVPYFIYSPVYQPVQPQMLPEAPNQSLKTGALDSHHQAGSPRPHSVDSLLIPVDSPSPQGISRRISIANLTNPDQPRYNAAPSKTLPSLSSILRANTSPNRIAKPIHTIAHSDSHLHDINTQDPSHFAILNLNPKPQSRKGHSCNICGRSFTRPNDLFRHAKSHWKETGDHGAFCCPFNIRAAKRIPIHARNSRSPSPSSLHYRPKAPGRRTTEYYDEIQKRNYPSDVYPGDILECHPSGFFSRCDTYKNHLRALHFQYPVGTKKKDRHFVSGSCKMCGKWFETVDEWILKHIETGSCDRALII